MVRRERLEREFPVPDNQGNPADAARSVRGNLRSAFNFLFDTASLEIPLLQASNGADAESPRLYLR
jgi:hypothetical protein